MNNHRQIAIVCYAQAGKGKALRICRHLEQELAGRKIAFTVFADEWPSHFSAFTDVFLVGGDGTLNFFINRYPNISIPVSIFKGGSGNDFAWKLYGNKSFAEQLEIALNGQAKPVDAGICNGYYFLNGAGIGFDGEVVQAIIDDGWLDLVDIRCIHRLTRICYLPKVEKGKHLDLSFVSSSKVKKSLLLPHATPTKKPRISRGLQ